MTDKIVVLVTTSSLRESKKIAKHLVEARLAACELLQEVLADLLHGARHFPHAHLVQRAVKCAPCSGSEPVFTVSF